MLWSDFAETCAAVGVEAEKYNAPHSFHRRLTSTQVEALRAALPEPVADVVDGGWGIGSSDLDLYGCVTGWNAVIYDDGYGEVLTLCNEGQVSLEEYGPDNLVADGYPLMGLYQLPIAEGDPWRAWVIDSAESRAYMARNAGNPELVKLL